MENLQGYCCAVGDSLRLIHDSASAFPKSLEWAVAGLFEARIQSRFRLSVSRDAGRFRLTEAQISDLTKDRGADPFEEKFTVITNGLVFAGQVQEISRGIHDRVGGKY